MKTYTVVQRAFFPETEGGGMEIYLVGTTPSFQLVYVFLCFNVPSIWVYNLCKP